VAAEERSVGTAAAITPALYVLVALLMALIPEHLMEGYEQASAALDGSDVLTMLATVIFAPLVEELIFRGLIFSRLERAMPGWLACLLSALLFGLCHGQWIWMTYAFLMGFLFGRMRKATGSLLPSLVSHAIFNTIGFLMGAMTSETEGGGFVLALLLLAIAFAVLVRGRLGELFGWKKPVLREDAK
jgi:membrane protease YdiL (CAAX protease family)